MDKQRHRTVHFDDGATPEMTVCGHVSFPLGSMLQIALKRHGLNNVPKPCCQQKNNLDASTRQLSSVILS